jgi:hypothetical protein
MAKRQFKGSPIRAKLPQGGLKKLCAEFEKSDTWIRRILDGKELGYPEVLKRAEELISAAEKEKYRKQQAYQLTLSKVEPNAK